MQKVVVNLEETIGLDTWLQDFNHFQIEDLSDKEVFDYYWTVPGTESSFLYEILVWTKVENTSLIYRLILKKDIKSIYKGETIGWVGEVGIIGEGVISTDIGLIEIYHRPAQYAPFDTWEIVGNVKLGFWSHSMQSHNCIQVRAEIETPSSSLVQKWFNGSTELVPKLSLEIKPCGKGCLVTLFQEKLLPYISEEFSNYKNSQ